jgi:UDP-N-acetylmuramate: L-alanyl-gamma-D-glutamyl-meso-diaminopimelate ligase
LITELCQHAKAGDSILIMSNGGFEGIYKKLLAALTARS